MSYGGIHNLVQDLNPIFQKYGRTPDQGIEQMGAWFSAIEKAPQATLIELAKQYGITLSAQPGTAPTSQPGAAPNPTADHRLDQALRELAQLRGQYDHQRLIEMTTPKAAEPEPKKDEAAA